MLGVCACSARFFSRMQRARCITLHCVWTRRSRTRTCNRAARKAAHSKRRGGAAEHLVVLALHDATAASFAAAALLCCTIGVENSPGPSIARAAGASHQFSCMRLFHLDDEPATTFWPRGRQRQPASKSNGTGVGGTGWLTPARARPRAGSSPPAHVASRENGRADILKRPQPPPPHIRDT